MNPTDRIIVPDIIRLVICGDNAPKGNKTGTLKNTTDVTIIVNGMAGPNHRLGNDHDMSYNSNLNRKPHGLEIVLVANS